MHVSDCSCVLLTVLIISGLLCIWYQMGEANQQEYKTGLKYECF